MTEIAIFVLISSIILLIAFVIIEYRTQPSDVEYNRMADIIRNEPIHKAFEKFVQYNQVKYICPDCMKHEFHSYIYEDRFAEIYCANCGYKEFYNLEILAGYKDVENELFKKENIKYIDSDYSTCVKCHENEKYHFLWNTKFPIKMGGYGEKRYVSFEIFTCKKCAFSDFFNYDIQEKMIMDF